MPPSIDEIIEIIEDAQHLITDFPGVPVFAMTQMTQDPDISKMVWSTAITT